MTRKVHSKSDPEPIRLICHTTAGNSDFNSLDEYNYATISISRGLAKHLLKFRAEWQRLRKLDDVLYCIELFDYKCLYGAASPLGLRPGKDDDRWYHCAEDPQLDSDMSSTAADTVKITEDGVIWSASPKHGEGYFETPCLKWLDLEHLSRGKVALPECPLEDEEEEEEEEVEDRDDNTG